MATHGEGGTALPLGPEVSVIAADRNGLLAFAKPAGVLSHPNDSRDQPRSLLTSRYILTGEFFECPPGSGAERVWLLNRLDSGTSGVILAATNEKLATEIRALFQRKTVRKVYAALVFGIPLAADQTWRDRLAVDKRGGQVRTQAGAGNIPAEAHMRLLKTRRADRPLSLIQLEPKTGRSHQLRVQCAKRHLPIVGDATYGDFDANRAFAKTTGEKRLFLHSFETRFQYEFGGRKQEFHVKAPLPKEFVAVMGL